MSSQSEKVEFRNKITQAKWLIEVFLEEDLSYEKLKKRPELVEDYRSGLKNNLLDKDRYKALDSEPGKYVYRYYYLLSQFWEQLKNKIIFYRIENRIPLTPKLGLRFIPTNPSSSTIDIKTEIPQDPTIGIFDKLKFTRWRKELHPTVDVDFESGNLHFMTDRIEMVRSFMNLIEGLPIDIFCECFDQSCRRWFIKSDKRKKYCSNNCASRNNQRDIRHNPDRLKVYEKIKNAQVERYRKKVLG